MWTKKRAQIFWVMSLGIGLVSCGSSSQSPVAAGGANNGGSNTSQNNYSMVVNTESDLPPCSASNKKQLIYVTSSQSFKTCEDSGWTAIEIGGLKVLSNSILSPLQENFCTYYSSFNTCLFRGGQLVKYSDGSVLLTGGYTNSLVTEATATSDAEYDQFNTTISFLIPASADYGFQLLDEKVARGTPGFRNLYLVYSKTTDKVALVYDTNNNQKPEATDEVLSLIARTDW